MNGQAVRLLVTIFLLVASICQAGDDVIDHFEYDGSCSFSIDCIHWEYMYEYHSDLESPIPLHLIEEALEEIQERRLSRPKDTAAAAGATYVDTLHLEQEDEPDYVVARLEFEAAPGFALLKYRFDVVGVLYSYVVYDQQSDEWYSLTPAFVTIDEIKADYNDLLTLMPGFFPAMPYECRTALVLSLLYDMRTLFILGSYQDYEAAMLIRYRLMDIPEHLWNFENQLYMFFPSKDTNLAPYVKADDWFYENWMEADFSDSLSFDPPSVEHIDDSVVVTMAVYVNFELARWRLCFGPDDSLMSIGYVSPPLLTDPNVSGRQSPYRRSK